VLSHSISENMRAHGLQGNERQCSDVPQEDSSAHYTCDPNPPVKPPHDFPMVSTIISVESLHKDIAKPSV